MDLRKLPVSVDKKHGFSKGHSKMLARVTKTPPRWYREEKSAVRAVSFTALIILVSAISTILISVTPALGLEVGIAEPLVWGPDDRWGTLARYAEIGENKMQELGINRHHEWISWKDCQSSGPGQINVSCFDLLDKVLSMSNQRGIFVDVGVQGAPSWVNGSNDGGFIPGDGDPANPDFQQFVSYYGDFMSQIVLRYKGRIYCWEIWSEPDSNWRIGRSASAEYKAAGYAYMLKQVYAKVKAANPDAVVIMGGPTAWNSDTYINKLYAEGAKNYFDIANIHPYTWNRWGDSNKPSQSALFAKIGSMRSIMDINGDNTKPIWITEVGWSTRGNSTDRVVTESQQAEYIIDAIETIKSRYPSVKVVDFFRLMDRQWYTSTSLEAGFGLLYTDVYRDGMYTGHARYEPKPSFIALKNYLATQSPNRAPEIQVQSVDTYWSSFQAYISKILTIDINVINSGTPANTVSITQVVASKDVRPVSSLPLALCRLDSGSGRSFIINVHIPNGVRAFKMMLKGETMDDGGNAYSFSLNSAES